MATFADSDLQAFLEWSTDSEVELVGKSLSAGGVHENLAIRCRVAGNERKFLLRMTPPVASFGFARNEVNPYDLQAEYEVLRDLQTSRLSVPGVCQLDAEGRFLGTPGYLMEFIEGPTVLEAARQENNSIDRRFAETLIEMNSITPGQVPSLIKKKGMPPQQPTTALSWIEDHVNELELPAKFSPALTYLRSEIPSERPLPAFGNGDLNPMNFICRPDGTITVVDWEYAGYTDPIAEIMQLHAWPEAEPFLLKHPIDRIYCEMTGIPTHVLKWYEVLSAITGWIYSSKDHNSKGMARHVMHLDRALRPARS